ncbi:MAG: hypothetical protein IT305_04210 [Chloroflexi bacterium]|nr:hypothetical protein [Chloroflexota bacterium]
MEMADVEDVNGRLPAIHPLRTADTLQLAAALLWPMERPPVRRFVCFDQR